MAPTLVDRYYYGYGCSNVDQYGNCYSSPWNTWGRWVLLVILIVFAIFVALVFSCINARRRRARGLPPRYGTSWATHKWGGNNQQNYQNNNTYNGAGASAAPPYSPPVQTEQYTGNTFNSNEGYYGQQSGIELQQPKNTYPGQRGGEHVYAAPEGPPPNKTYNNDGIIR